MISSFGVRGDVDGLTRATDPQRPVKSQVVPVVLARDLRKYAGAYLTLRGAMYGQGGYSIGFVEKYFG